MLRIVPSHPVKFSHPRKPIYLPSNATDASRGRPPAVFETLARPSTLRASRLRIPVKRAKSNSDLYKPKWHRGQCCGQKWECACVAQTKQVRDDSGKGESFTEFLVKYSKARYLWVLRTPQNNKEEGARAKKLVTCGTRSPLGRGQSMPFSAQGAHCSAPEP